MAIALTPFRAMCGFRELQEIRKLVLSVSPERFALGDASVVQGFVDDTSTETFKPFFESIMKTEAETVTVAVDALLLDCARSLSLNKLEDEARKVVELALELNAQFPGDVGVFCAFFLQVIDLAPGEAIFLGAGEPHAYVSGGAHLTSYQSQFLHVLTGAAAAGRYRRSDGDVRQRPPRGAHTETPRCGQPARVSDMDIWRQALGHACAALVGRGRGDGTVQQGVRPARAGVFGRAGRAAPRRTGDPPRV